MLSSPVLALLLPCVRRKVKYLDVLDEAYLYALRPIEMSPELARLFHYFAQQVEAFTTETLPKLDPSDDLKLKLCRAALLGVSAACVSDCVSNSIRVLKTTTQTSTVPIGYMEALKIVIEKDGIAGLMFRGLVTKIISNGCQGILFSVLWRLGQDMINARQAKKE